MKDEHVAADDYAQGQESVAEDEVERHEDGEAELEVLDVVGGNHDDAGHGDVEDAEEAVDDDQLVQECLGGLLEEKVDQRHVGDQDEETEDDGGDAVYIHGVFLILGPLVYLLNNNVMPELEQSTRLRERHCLTRASPC